MIDAFATAISYQQPGGNIINVDLLLVDRE